MPMKLDAIAAGFIGLLETHSYAKITIQMICDNTPASRNSFYYHFKSKEALTEWICFRDYMKHSYPYFQIETEQIRATSLFQYIKKNKAFYNAIYQADSGVLLHRCLAKAYSDGTAKEYVDEYAQHLLRKHKEGRQVKMDLNVFRAYLSSGLAAVVIHWIADGMKAPIEAMARDAAILLGKSPETIISDHLF